MLTYARYAALFEIARALPASPILVYPWAVKGTMLTFLSKLIVKTFYKEVIVEGVDNLPDSGPAIFTPNHPNALLDPLLLFFLPLDFRIRFVAKAPLFRIALLGWLLRNMHAIPVVRRFEADGQIDYRTFFISCVDTLASGNSIAIFPEGVSLPQPHMAPLKTGVARLFFLALERGLNVPIIPVGLNYEQGSIFRTSVYVRVAPPLATSDVIEKYKVSPHDSVKDLTARINRTLEEHVFQSENFADRELILVLESIYREGENSDSWTQRFGRLKQIENGLKALRNSHFSDIDHLRQLLIRYTKTKNLLENLHSTRGAKNQRSVMRFFLFVCGFPAAFLGRLLTVVPYQSVNVIVKHIKMYDESQAATHKIAYALFFYPLAFLLESVLVHLWLGWIASLMFAIAVIPLSYFSLYYFEQFHERGVGIRMPSSKIKKNLEYLLVRQINKERDNIVEQVDKLAAAVTSSTRK